MSARKAEPGQAGAPRRAVLYARVSTEEQVEGTSLGVQITRGRAWCELNGHEVAGEYVDEGESGAKASRPAFDTMMAAVHSGGIDAVVVAHLDRFGRSVEHNSVLLGELDRLGVSFVSTTQAFDASTPMGRAMRHMASIFAEVERDMIRERMVSGVTAVASDGHWPGGPPPFGYRLVRTGRHTDLVIDDDEAETVQMIASCLIDRRMTSLETAMELNSLGRPPRRRGRWSVQSLRNLVLNGTGWSGTWQYRRAARKGKPGKDPHGRYGSPIDLEVPAILSPERQGALRAHLERTSTGPVVRKHTYLFAGLIQSPHGANFQGVTSPGRPRFMGCAHAHFQRPAGQRCKCRRISADAVEEIVWAEVVRVLSDPDSLREPELKRSSPPRRHSVTPTPERSSSAWTTSPSRTPPTSSPRMSRPPRTALPAPRRGPGPTSMPAAGCNASGLSPSPAAQLRHRRPGTAPPDPRAARRPRAGHRMADLPHLQRRGDGRRRTRPGNRQATQGLRLADGLPDLPADQAPPAVGHLRGDP